MLERVSIIEEITRGGYEASLITTFNAYLPFYEEVVLRKLIGQGAQHNIVLMDAVQCSQSISQDPPRIAGRNYSLIPMTSAGAFHPKIILLVGKNKGALFIGSHNLTLSGFGYNRELTNLIRFQGDNDTETISTIQTAWYQVLGWVESQGERLPNHLLEMVQNLVKFAPWLAEKRDVSPEQCQILSSQNGAPSMWEQFISLFQGQASQILVSGAFFDSQLSFIERIQKDLNPERIVVAVDPKSVKVPSDINISGVSFVNAASLGSIDKTAGYLHAKSLVVQTKTGDYYLISGSANPSNPAWLRPGLSGNTEIMLLRRGKEAQEETQMLGLLAIPDLPELTSDDWLNVQNNWQRQTQKEQLTKTSSIGICIATDKGIILQPDLFTSPGPFTCNALGFDKKLLWSKDINTHEEELIIEAPEGELSKVHFIVVHTESSNKMFLVHHQQQIEESSRTGSQRQFRSALASLNSNSPDLETLIKCVDKIIFAKSEEINRSDRTARGASPSESSDKIDKGASLSMDLSETRKTQKKFRLRNSDELAYLLDVLIYHLHLESDGEAVSSHENRDSRGRSEEEQVDADDEEATNEAIASEEIALKTLSLCHGKIQSLVGRMVTQLQALTDGKVPFDDAVVRLTGVLAVLRQLRNCDGKVSWVRQGQTTVPMKERKRLLNKITSTLFEAPNSILSVSEIGVSEADELAHLRGLILWLAWDSDVHLIDKKMFQESSKDKEERLQAKALMLSLAQLVKGDEVVIEEARQSIGPLCSSDMDWLSWVLNADQAILNFIEKNKKESFVSQIEPGDIGYLEKLPQLGARMILHLNSGKANLAFFDNDNGYRRYQTGSLRFAKFEDLMG